MEARDMLDVSMIASLSGELKDGQLSRARPFRSPHHSASMPALVGGGLRARPGEMALAHHGVLFLDELPEFQPRVLESLRQPMETGETVVARANYHITYPARFQLVAAMNPCKCGMAGEPGHQCRQGPRCAADYQARISGPLLDRMDIQIELQAVKASDLTLPPPKEKSADVAARVATARARQAARFRALGHAHLRTNAEADGRLLEEMVKLDAAGTNLIRDAAEAMNLSARGYHRVLRVARSIADLDGHEAVSRLHLAEALSYRQKPASLRVAA
jgi:magnesium chelatase family protein